MKEGCIFPAADTASQFGGRQRCFFLRYPVTRRQGSAGDAAWCCAAGQGLVGTGVCTALSKQLAGMGRGVRPVSEGHVGAQGQTTRSLPGGVPSTCHPYPILPMSILMVAGPEGGRVQV